MAGEVIGRDEELARIFAFLDREPPGALLLEGAAGIGKTTLWHTGVIEAEGRGHAVLACNPGGAETHFSLSGLRDLLEGVFDEVASELPEPQQHALAVALLHAEPDNPPPPSAIAASFLNVLRALAGRGPVLVAVDDVQWLDSPSAAVIEYAARRIRSDPIRVFLSARTETGTAMPIDLDRAYPDATMERIEVGPLTLGALGQVVRMELGAVFPRQALRRLHEASGGNPLFALELVRALERSGQTIEPGQPLPVPDNLHDLVRGRIELMPEATRLALLAVAALSHPTVELLELVFEHESAARLLRPALEAQIVQVSGDRVRFTHPLLASAVYADGRRSARRQIHRRLAELVRDPEERARHLALGAEEPDGEIAAAVDIGVVSAAGRGAHDVAVELAELAVRLTPASDVHARQRRTIDVAEHGFASGRFARAEELVTQLLADLPAGPERARALVLSVRSREENLEDCAVIYEKALDEARGETALEAEIHRYLVETWIVLGDLGRSTEHARLAVELTERTGDTAGLAMALADLAHIENLTANITPGLLERALVLEEKVGGLPPWYRPSVVLGLRLMFDDRLADARELLEQAHRDAGEQANEYARAVMQMHLVQLEMRAGEWPRAKRYADDSLSIFWDSGSGNESIAAYVQALVAAHLGLDEEAREWGRRSLAASEAAGDAVFRLHVEGVLGFLELSSGDSRAAARWLRPLPEIYAARGYGQPNVNPVQPDLIEALINLGELREAETYLLELEERAGALAGPWARAATARCRGLLSAAGGDTGVALVELSEAVEAAEQLPRPLERGRALLALGQVQRRARKRADARRSLEAALEVFDDLGARLWAERARGEMARLGGRASSGLELTSTERQVAELAAQGKPNKEIASTLVVSVKTVEFHLGNVYRKLSVRSRVELAQKLSGAAVKA
jgi:DNA-binding CsgD family transcriptional regulator